MAKMRTSCANLDKTKAALPALLVIITTGRSSLT